MTSVKAWGKVLDKVTRTCVEMSRTIEVLDEIGDESIYPATIKLVAGLSNQIEKVANIKPARTIDFEEASKTPSNLTMARIKSDYVQTLRSLNLHAFKLMVAHLSQQADDAIDRLERVREKCFPDKFSFEPKSGLACANHLRMLQCHELDDWKQGRLSSDEDFKAVMLKRIGGTQDLLDHLFASEESSVMQVAVDHALKCVTDGKFTPIPYTGLNANTIEFSPTPVVGGTFVIEAAPLGMLLYSGCKLDPLGRDMHNNHHTFQPTKGEGEESIRNLMTSLGKIVSHERALNFLIDFKTKVLPKLDRMVKCLEENQKLKLPLSIWSHFYFIQAPIERGFSDHVGSASVVPAMVLFSPIYGYMSKLTAISEILDGIECTFPIIMDYARLNVSAQHSSVPPSITTVDSGVTP